ncbi:agamous-like MADS-box protein AP3 isoform X1 [Daucus carota subsp. sativus]|uniref:agamous-like MADS-box protein AP3 isoform X1 n=1 Tax=Daucus carota subsp. sativus TaxID=79200 RepID=UPI0007B25574|nr:PREDICTED: floral homeotic protein DEFICIENS-like isoform X1 [Daucus carota subsp. sativus]XP_017249832.1 PREDICTED: floral homeotic protein DEFICIENS-like isoform X2 [Daucus carota subsp. sativus]
MARGKIQIKKIENATNRQVTYSKRRKGLFKKARELSVLCDASVSVIMISTTKKAHVYTNPISTKEFYDMYQKLQGVDLWSSCYEKMKEHLIKLKEVNLNLNREIRRKMGECLDGLNFDELCNLENKMENTVMAIREKKMKMITSQTENIRKKIRNSENEQKFLLHQFTYIQELRGEDPGYAKVELGEEHKSYLGLSHALQGILALNFSPNQPDPHSGV